MVLHPEVIRYFGTSTAAFLSRLNYWVQGRNSGVMHKGMRWIFNTAQEWSQQLGISDRQVRRIVAELKEAGIILVEKLADYKSNRTNYYTINYDRLNELFEEKNLPTEVFLVSASSGQNVLMTRTKNTNKENNISETTQETLTAPLLPNTQIQAITGNHENSPASGIPEKVTVQEMLAYWNTIFPTSQIEMNANLAPLLRAALQVKFSSRLKEWQHYCRTIESSAYLTGKSFNLSIYWALKYTTIDRIKAGDFGVKSIPNISEKETLEQRFVEQIGLLAEPEKCKSIRLKLLKVYGAYAYKHWFQSLEFFLNGERVQYKAPSRFHADYIAREYKDILI